ncbi:MAG: antiterminator Q family protein [Enterobacteriaceae bacterium]
MNNIKLSLEMWGNWARCKIGTEYSSVNITFQDILPTSGTTTLRVEDKEGMIIDAAVAGLRQFDVLAYYT